MDRQTNKILKDISNVIKNMEIRLNEIKETGIKLCLQDFANDTNLHVIYTYLDHVDSFIIIKPKASEDQLAELIDNIDKHRLTKYISIMDDIEQVPLEPHYFKTIRPHSEQ